MLNSQLISNLFPIDDLWHLFIKFLTGHFEKVIKSKNF